MFIFYQVINSNQFHFFLFVVNESLWTEAKSELACKITFCREMNPALKE